MILIELVEKIEELADTLQRGFIKYGYLQE